MSSTWRSPMSCVAWKDRLIKNSQLRGSFFGSKQGKTLAKILFYVFMAMSSTWRSPMSCVAWKDRLRKNSQLRSSFFGQNKAKLSRKFYFTFSWPWAGRDGHRLRRHLATKPHLRQIDKNVLLEHQKHETFGETFGQIFCKRSAQTEGEDVPMKGKTCPWRAICAHEGEDVPINEDAPMKMKMCP